MSQYAKEIKHILATLSERGDEDDSPLPDKEEIDTIHVYPVEGGGILLTRVPLESDESVASMIDSRDDQTITAHTIKTPPLFVAFLLLLCVFELGDLADNQLLALMTPIVSVTIVPQTQIVTATADLPAATIQAHGFSPLTLSMSQTVPASGTGHQDARAATGTVTFYNGQLQSVTVPSGTRFTGRDGIPVVITRDARIPSLDPTTTPPTVGQVTVSAQAAQVGAHGNIAAFDLSDPCCAASVIVKNLTSFSNGQDARTFPIVTRDDIRQVVTQLTPRLLKSEQAALTSQLQAGEQLFSPTCRAMTNMDHQPGDEAAHIKVTVSETCIAEAYNQQAAQAQGESLLNRKAVVLSKRYSLVGTIHPTILAKQEATNIRVQFTGTYVYQINQQALTTLIAGQLKHDALQLLATQPGIQHAMITGLTDDNPVPIDSARIHFQVLIGL